MIIGYSSAYLAHLDQLKRDEKERYGGIPPFIALLIAAIALHIGVLIPWMVLKSRAPLPETKQIHLSFGKKTGEYTGQVSTSAKAVPSSEFETPSSGSAVTSMDQMFSPPAPSTSPVIPLNDRSENKSLPPAHSTSSPILQPSPTASVPSHQQNAQSSIKMRLGMASGSGRQVTGLNNRQGGNSSAEGGGGEGGANTAQREVISKYEQLLSGWIDRHKIYPASALKQGMEGKVVLRLRISRNGKVVRSDIEHSSNHPLLDQAVLETVQRSSPMPTVPSGYPGGAQVEFLIPIRFSVR